MDLETAAQEFWRISREARRFGADGLTLNAVRHLQKNVEHDSIQLRLGEIINENCQSPAQAP